MRAKLGDIITVVGLFVTAALGAASLIISRDASDKVDAASHVELGDLASNSDDFENPWQILYQPISDRTVFVGVTRWVPFRTPFQNVPEVVAAFRGIDKEQFDDRLETWKSKLTTDDQHRLNGIHVGTSVRGARRDGFNLDIGIGVPSAAAPGLRDSLEDTAINMDIFKITRGTQQLAPGHDTPEKLSLDEKWMLNFYTEVGTFDVVWVATETK